MPRAPRYAMPGAVPDDPGRRTPLVRRPPSRHRGAGYADRPHGEPGRDECDDQVGEAPGARAADQRVAAKGQPMIPPLARGHDVERIRAGRPPAGEAEPPGLRAAHLVGREPGRRRPGREWIRTEPDADRV